MLKIWNYLNYKDHFYLCIQRNTNAFLTLTEVFVFQEVSQSYNVLQLGVKRCGSVFVLSVDMFDYN